MSGSKKVFTTLCLKTAHNEAARIRRLFRRKLKDRTDTIFGYFSFNNTKEKWL